MPSKARQLAVVSVAAFGAVYLAFVHTEIGRSLDQAALVDRTASIEVSSAEVGLVDAGPAVVAIVLLATTAWLRQDWRLALGVAGMIGLSSAAALGLAHVLPQVDPDQPSFPSGDATLGMAVACGLLFVGAPTRRGSMVPIAAAIAIVVGVVLVALDWHRPAEVAGGYFLAVAVACAIVPLARGTPCGSDAGAPASPGSRDRRGRHGPGPRGGGRAEPPLRNRPCQARRLARLCRR